MHGEDIPPIPSGMSSPMTGVFNRCGMSSTIPSGMSSPMIKDALLFLHPSWQMICMKSIYHLPYPVDVFTDGPVHIIPSGIFNLCHTQWVSSPMSPRGYIIMYPPYHMHGEDIPPIPSGMSSPMTGVFNRCGMSSPMIKDALLFLHPSWQMICMITDTHWEDIPVKQVKTLHGKFHR